MRARHGGSGSRYSRECYCGLCTEANRRRVALWRAEVRAERVLRDGRLVATRAGLTHGKPATYQNWGCQCDPCTVANRAAQRERRARERQGR